MKRFILFLSVFFFAFSVHIKAQTIDNVIVTDTIDCPGLKGDIQVNILNPGNITYNVVLQQLNSSFNYVSVKVGQWALNTQTLTHPFTNLSQGTYRVLLVNPACSPPYNPAINLPADTCIYDDYTQPMVEPLPLSLSPSDNGLDCWDSQDGFITVELDGYTQPYTVWLYDGTGLIEGPTLLNLADTSYTFLTPVPAGSYTIEGTGPINCPIETVSHTIVTPDTLRPDAHIDQEISCYQAGDGILSVDFVTGGTPPYTYLWTGPAPAGGQTGHTVPGLGPGTYTCTITDSLGCDSTISLTLIEPQELTASVDTIGSNDCNGDCDVTIEVTVLLPGAGGAYTYSINGVANPQGVSTFQGQCAGSYMIDVVDVNGCPATTVTPNPVIIDEPDPISVYVSALDYNGFQVSCFGSCDAEITIDSVTGGNLPQYGTSLPYLGGIAFLPDTIIDSAFCAGSHTFTVTDDLGCSGDGSITINEPPLFSISTAITPNTSGFDVSCPGICDGEILVTPNGGVPNANVDYYITGSLFDSQISPLSGTADSVCGFNTNGEDTIVAIDANGCIDTAYTQLSEPPLFNYSMGAVMENCALGNGEAGINITQGGTGVGTYTHHWSGPHGNGSVAPSTFFPNSDTITNLQYGWYIDSVTDGAGCYFIDSILVDSGSILVDVSVLVPCNDSNGVITLTNSITLTSIVWVNDTLNFSTVPPNYLQNDSNFTVSTLEDLSPGTYWYEIQLTGCDPVRDSVVVGPGVTMNASLDVFNSVLDLDCFGDMTDSIIIHVVDGFNALNSPNNNSFNAYTIIPTYNVAISDAPGSSNNFLQGGGVLPAGNYDIVITPNMFDPFGNPIFTNCMDTVPVSVTEPDSLEFTLDSVQTLCYGDSTGIIYVDNIFGGNSGQYNYTWTDSFGTIISSSDSVNGLPAGMYYLSVQDSLSCLPATIDSIEVTSPTEISWTTTITAIDSCEYHFAVGSILLTSAGGMGAHSYNWTGTLVNGSPFNSSAQNISGLTSGMYYITITDTNLCWKEDSVFIENGQNPALDSSSFTNVSCAGAHDGSYIGIVDSVNGSLSFPYTFWDFSTNSWQAGYIPSASSLGPGDTIHIRLKDAFGCVDSSFYVITEPDTLVIQSFTPLVFPGGANISCFEVEDGAIDIDSVTGGTMPYYYSTGNSATPNAPIGTGFYNPDSTVHLFDSLGAGLYYLDVIDANGCAYRDSIILIEPDSLQIDSFSTSAYFGGWGVSCNGFNDGSAITYVSGGTYDGVIYTYTYGWSNNDSLANADTLSGDSWYVVNVTDTNGCHAIDSVYISQPTPLTIAITSDSVLCVGGDRGTATVFPSGATPNYYYLWNNEDLTSPTYVNPNDTVGSNNDTTATADTLRAGVYVVQVWDENGCYITDSIEIFEPSISVEIDSLIVTQMTCSNWNNANVDILTTGPQPLPYYYYVYDELNPINIVSQGNLGFNDGLMAGNYVAMVEDNLGCLDRDTFEIYALDSVRIDDVTAINISCNGYNDGYIQNIIPSGGIPPYTYSVDGGTQYSSWICNPANPACTNIGGVGYVFTGLTPGWHTVEIWDSTGICTNSKSIEIIEPTSIQYAISTNSYYNYSIQCNGEVDTAFIIVSGGGAPYNITLNGITNTTLNSYTWPGISAGSQTFEILDANGCMIDTTIIFTEPPAITATAVIDSILCIGSSTGSITAIVSGGVGQGQGNNYTYQWYDGNTTTTPIVGETSFVINNLTEGDYTLEVTDNNNCSETFTWSIGENALDIDEFATNFLITNATCFEDCDGSISVVVNGGVPSQSGAPYLYEWLGYPQTGSVFVGACEGTYTCTVTDMAGCSVTASFYVSEPSELIANITVAEEIDCNGNSTGKLTDNTSGGTLQYNWTWSDGSTLSTLSNIPAGLYTLFVEDANGCTDETEINLSDPDPLDIPYITPNSPLDNIDITHVDCYGESTGSIWANAVGGSPTPGIPGYYDYKLTDSQGNNTLMPNINTGATFNNLSTGNYTVTVTDANGCFYTTSDIFVDEPDEALSLVIDAYNGTCNSSAFLVAHASGGTLNYTYSIDGSIPQTTPEFFNLNAQTYTEYLITVEDANGCEVTNSAIVRDYDNVFLPDYTDFETINAECIGEEINIDVEECNECSYVWTRNGEIIAITSSLSITTDLTWESEPLKNTLTLTITDESCNPTYSTSIEVDVLINATDAACSISPSSRAGTILDPATFVQGDLITISASSAFDSWIWTNNDGDTISQDREFTIDAVSSDCYTVYAESNDGCIATCFKCAAVGSTPYDAFSPNGDGYNDYWYIDDIESFTGSIVQIFNRWGTLIFEGSCSAQCWDGTIDGKDAPIGTYYYTIDHNDGSELLKGAITLVR